MTADLPTPAASMSEVYGDEKARMAAIEQMLGPQRLAASPVARCIAPALIALDWFGSPKALLNGLPGDGDPVEPDDLVELFGTLGYRVQTRAWRGAPGEGDLRHLPVGSVVAADAGAVVFLGSKDGVDWWHDGEAVVSGRGPAGTGRLLVIEADPDHQPLAAPQTGWLGRLVYAARGEIRGILAVSLACNLLALVVSLFTMFVYNAVIPTGAASALRVIVPGALAAVLGAWGLRLARARLMAGLSAWAGAKVADVTMRKVLTLPAEVSGRLGAENNLTRLRSIEGVRQWFSGSGGTAFIDYPFVVIFLLVIAILGGWIVLVPLVGLLVIALASSLLSLHVQVRSREVGSVSRKLGEMTTVLTHRLRALNGVPASTLWTQRLGDLVGQSAAAHRNHALATGLAQTVGQALAMLTVLATMGVGVTLVLDGAMNAGGLIATMMLIWRVTTPAQQFHSTRLRLQQLNSAGRQFERLMASAGEVSDPKVTSPVSTLEPKVDVDRVFYRYSADREPALGGISFSVEPGQIVAIVGPNGAGKSTLLQVLAGVRNPQNGRVLVGGRDIRQFDPAEYRGWLGYLPQEIVGLPITAREAFKLRRPASSDAELVDAVTRVVGDDWRQLLGVDSVEALLNLRIAPWRQDREAFRGRFIVRLVAATLAHPPLLLLDDPLGDQDPALDARFVSLLEGMRGKSTILLATHRPDLIQRADAVCVLNEGALVHYGPVNPEPAAD